MFSSTRRHTRDRRALLHLKDSKEIRNYFLFLWCSHTTCAKDVSWQNNIFIFFIVDFRISLRISFAVVLGLGFISELLLLLISSRCVCLCVCLFVRSLCVAVFIVDFRIPSQMILLLSFFLFFFKKRKKKTGFRSFFIAPI